MQAVPSSAAIDAGRRSLRPGRPGGPSDPPALERRRAGGPQRGPGGPATPRTFHCSGCSLPPAGNTRRRGTLSTPVDFVRQALITLSSSLDSSTAPAAAPARASAVDRDDACAERSSPSVSLHRSSSRAGRSRDSCARARRLVSETARPVPKGRFCARIGTQSTHSRDRNPLPPPRPATATGGRPPRPRARRAAAARAEAQRPAWELTAPAPDVARFEYQLELIDAKGKSEWIVDPANPKTASGPWGDKSVWEEPGYAPPDWLAAEPPSAEPKSVTIPSKILQAELPALIWAHPDATARRARC